MALIPELRYLHRLPCRAGDDEGSHAALRANDTILVRHTGAYEGKHRKASA